MGFVKERVSFLKGLAEGIQLNESTNEGKLLKAIIDVLDDIALTVDDIEEVQEQLSEQVDNIDENLEEIQGLLFNDRGMDDEDDEFLTEIECPNCKEKVCIDEAMLDEEQDTIKCPVCNSNIDIEWECDCGCNDCGDNDDDN